jgi:8-oxo-dGTP diphosphatase
MKDQKKPRLVVGVLIKRGSKYLLVKEQLESKRDLWIIPGGGVEFGETLEQAAIREMQEELGITVAIKRFLGFKEAVFPKHNYHSVIFFYLATAPDATMKLEKKIKEAQFFTFKQIQSLEVVESAQWLFNTSKEL